MNELLPIGTIVKLKKDKIAIITGYDEIYWDDNNFIPINGYIIDEYPTNWTGFEHNFSEKEISENFAWHDISTYVKDYVLKISKNDIEEIIYMGYKDEEFETMNLNAQKITEKLKD